MFMDRAWFVSVRGSVEEAETASTLRASPICVRNAIKETATAQTHTQAFLRGDNEYNPWHNGRKKTQRKIASYIPSEPPVNPTDFGSKQLFADDPRDHLPMCGVVFLPI